MPVDGHVLQPHSHSGPGASNSHSRSRPGPVRRALMSSIEDPSTNPRITGMVMATTPSVVKAGRVVLHAVNASHDLTHEVVLVRLNGSVAPCRSIPLTTRSGEADQDLGEVSNLAPEIGRFGDDPRARAICGVLQPARPLPAGMLAELTVTQ